MEQVRDIFINNDVLLPRERIEMLERYAVLLFEESKLHNLTGLKNLNDIICTLIIKSYDPLKRWSVPRGTSFVDFGTGAGIPGVVLGICFPEITGVLIDSNSKKTNFIARVIEVLEIENILIVNGRVEELIDTMGMRNSFDWCFSRAFGPLYYSIEFGLPLLKKGGSLYIYSHLTPEAISDEMMHHVKNLGGRLRMSEERNMQGIDEGLLVFKEGETSSIFPRRFPVIKRASEKIHETQSGEMV